MTGVGEGWTYKGVAGSEVRTISYYKCGDMIWYLAGGGENLVT